MELKATVMGKRLARHPYHTVRMLPAGIEVVGDQHEYTIPFNQLIDCQCKRGVVWGELEFELPEQKVVRLHGTEWQQTLQFYQHLTLCWQQWSEQMAAITRQVLTSLNHEITEMITAIGWLDHHHLLLLQEKIHQHRQAIPLPMERLAEFADCVALWQQAERWLLQPAQQSSQHNQQWIEQIKQRYADFFNSIESRPLNDSQINAVINGERTVRVLAGAGSGKTSVLVAKSAFILQRSLASAAQILLLAFGRDAATELTERVISRTRNTEIQARTFHSLARHIIEVATNKKPLISQLETDTAFRHQFLLQTWQQQCQQKKVYARGFRHWLRDELGWDIAENEYWNDSSLTGRLVTRLDSWLATLRMAELGQQALIERADGSIRLDFGRRLKLLSPLLKAWNSTLKKEGAVDFSGLIKQAHSLVEKGRFVSPWKYILVDEFQDISPLRAKLLQALLSQSQHSHLFAVGDDWQAIYRFAGAEVDLTTSFHAYFGAGATCYLDTTYRFNQRIGEVANRFIQQNPQQLKKPLNSLIKTAKKPIQLLPEAQLEALLDKMSGYVAEHETVLLLARYQHQSPQVLQHAATRWPTLNLIFKTMHASKGQEADYVIVLGLQKGKDGFPAECGEGILQQGIMPTVEHYPYAEERRLAYVALTRGRQQVWLLFNETSPSCFVAELKSLGVKHLKKP